MTDALTRNPTLQGALGGAVIFQSSLMANVEGAAADGPQSIHSDFFVTLLPQLLDSRFTVVVPETEPGNKPQPEYSIIIKPGSHRTVEGHSEFQGGALPGGHEMHSKESIDKAYADLAPKPPTIRLITQPRQLIICKGHFLHGGALQRFPPA